MPIQWRDWFNDLVIVFFAAIGLGGAVALLKWMPGVPSMLISVFLGVAVAALVYRFLGGISSSTSVAFGAVKLGGSLAALLASAYLIDDRMAVQLEKMRGDAAKTEDRRIAIAANHLSPSALAGRWEWQSAAENLVATMDFVEKDGALTFDGQMSTHRDGVRKIVFAMDNGTAMLLPDDRLSLAFTAKEPGGRTYRLESVQPLRRQLSFTGGLRVPREDPNYASMIEYTWGIGMQQDR